MLNSLRLPPVAFVGLVLAGPLILVACGGARREPTSSGRFEVSSAPLTLPDVSDVCYRLTVTNGPNRTGDIVVQQDVCADRFGDGKGGLAYVATCDASAADDNSVTLEILDVFSGEPPVAVADGTYQNPCGEIADWDDARDTLVSGEDPFGPCTRNQACVENADRRVVFDLTIMRSAGQGFIDAAVEFDDIFCSAKLDCASQFLHHPVTDERGPTAIVTFACTAGENEQTYLHVSDLFLTCTLQDGEQLVFQMNNDTRVPTLGQHGPVPSLVGGAPGVYNWATYQGDESLTSRGEPLEKCFWNRAVGLDIPSLEALHVEECTLSGTGTATDVPAASLTPPIAPGTAYPIVKWDVVVYRAGEPEPTLCDNNPLNGLGSGVTTTYVTSTTDLTTLLPMTDTMACGSDVVACAAGPTVSGQTDSVVVTGDGNELAVALGAQATTVTLPAGFHLGPSCYRDACCASPAP